MIRVILYGVVGALGALAVLVIAVVAVSHDDRDERSEWPPVRGSLRGPVRMGPGRW